MSSKTPRTGLASRMRDWMSGRSGKFTGGQLALALDIPVGKRDPLHQALQDFVRRGEVVPLGIPGIRSRKDSGDTIPNSEEFGSCPRAYAYNRGWHRVHKGVLSRRIYKALYISGTFAVTDIIRLAETPSRAQVDKIIRRLRREGHLQAVGRRLCAHGAGAETIYHISDRDRFRREVMG